MRPESDMTRFALIRHAETEWNRKRLIQGQDDSPLTKYGEDQAIKWGHVLKGHNIQRIISSDSGRTMKTASLINLALRIPLIPEPRLREQDWGLWTGMSMEDIKNTGARTFTRLQKAGWEFQPPGGESRKSVCERSCRALSDAGKKWHGEKILIITHEGVIKCIISLLKEERSPDIKEDSLLSNHVHWVSVYENEMTLEDMNALPLS